MNLFPIAQDLLSIAFIYLSIKLEIRIEEFENEIDLSS